MSSSGSFNTGASKQHETMSLLGLAKSTKQTTPLSGIFLISGLTIFLSSVAIMLPIIGTKVSGNTMTWTVAFLPIWIGDGLTVICLVGAMISACCSIVQGTQSNSRTKNKNEDQEGDLNDDSNNNVNGMDDEDPQNVLQKNREMVAQGPSHVNHIKHVLTSGFCCPFMFLPPLPILGLLFGFHVNLWRYLSTTSGDTNMYNVMIPLYIVMGIIFFPYMLCRGSLLTLFFLISMVTTLILIPYKIENKVEDITWFFIFLPLLSSFGLIFLQVLYVFVNDLCWSYRQRLRLQTNLQRWSLFGYLVGLMLTICGGIWTATEIDAGTFKTNGMNKILPFFFGILICVMSVVAIACDITRDFIYNQGARPLPDTEDTEEESASKYGAEEWLGIGTVDVAPSVLNGNSSSCIRCVDYICGGRTKMANRRNV